MKKTAPARYLVILVSALFALSLPHLVLAHSPEKVDVYYDFKSQTLVVKITHPSNNPDRHFVKEVEVKKNGQVVQRGEYTKQDGQHLYVHVQDDCDGERYDRGNGFLQYPRLEDEKYQPGV